MAKTSFFLPNPGTPMEGITGADGALRPQYGVLVGNPVAFSGAGPFTTAANGDAAFAFTSEIHHLWIQNNSGSPIYFQEDSAANLGSAEVAAGASIFLDTICSTLHIYSTLATSVNGTTAGGIVVKAWE